MEDIKYNNNIQYQYVWYSYKQALDKGRATYFLDYDKREPIIGTIWTPDNIQPIDLYGDLMYVGRAKHILGPCLDFPKIDMDMFNKVFRSGDKIRKIQEFFTDKDLEIQ